jgi:hypothetical protein
MILNGSIRMRLPAVVMLVAGCSASIAPVNNPKRTPNYAKYSSYTGGVVNQISYEVDCVDRVIYIDRHEKELFYREDGSQRTREEFCQNYDSISRARRRSE